MTSYRLNIYVSHTTDSSKVSENIQTTCLVNNAMIQHMKSEMVQLYVSSGTITLAGIHMSVARWCRSSYMQLKQACLLWVSPENFSLFVNIDSLLLLQLDLHLFLVLNWMSS